jgi:hypothetical protein
LTTKQGSPSQFGQDLFLFFNIFKYWPQEKRRGFYVDSGANHAIQLSNTYFFDVCLGWYDDDDGLTLLRPTVVADLLHFPTLVRPGTGCASSRSASTSLPSPKSDFDRAL